MSERENASSDTSSSSESSDSEGEDFSIPDIGSLKPYDHEQIRSSLDEASSSDDKSDNSSDEEQARIGNTDWCLCERCLAMDTYAESLCCQDTNEIPEDFFEGL